MTLKIFDFKAFTCKLSGNNVNDRDDKDFEISDLSYFDEDN